MRWSRVTCELKVQAEESMNMSRMNTVLNFIISPTENREIDLNMAVRVVKVLKDVVEDL